MKSCWPQTPRPSQRRSLGFVAKEHDPSGQEDPGGWAQEPDAGESRGSANRKRPGVTKGRKQKGQKGGWQVQRTVDWTSSRHRRRGRKEPAVTGRLDLRPEPGCGSWMCWRTACPRCNVSASPRPTLLLREVDGNRPYLSLRLLSSCRGHVGKHHVTSGNGD